MAISRIGATSVNGATVAALPTHASGDVLVALAYRTGFAVAPTVPGTWTTVTGSSGAANNNAAVMAWHLCTSSSESIPTFTNATQVIVVCYRGVHNTVPFGAAATAGSATANDLQYPALTLTNTSGSSWILGGVAIRSGNVAAVVGAAPTGMTNVTTVVDPGGSTLGSAGFHDSNTGKTAWTLVTVAQGSTTGHRQITAELLAAASATTHTGTASLAAVIQRQAVTRTASLNAALKKVQTATVGLAAALQKGRSVSAVSDAALKKALTVLVGGDAALQRVMTKTATADAALRAEHDLVAALDAALRAAKAVSIGLDSYLSAPGAGIVVASLTAALEKTSAVTATVGAALRTTNYRTAILDAVVVRAGVLQTEVGAILARAVTIVLGIDAALMDTVFTSTTLDAVIGDAFTALARRHILVPARRGSVLVPPGRRALIVP